MKKKLLPLILTIVVFVLDQLTKQLIVLNIPAYTIGASFFGDFLRIIHVYNPGIAFSMGIRCRMPPGECSLQWRPW